MNLLKFIAAVAGAITAGANAVKYARRLGLI
jgi:hypothetical protein